MTITDELDAERPVTASWSVALHDVPQPGPWHRVAACRTAPSSIFFVTRGESVDPAREVCRGCAVREPCLEYALSAPDELKGVWGGETERGRRRLRAERRAASAIVDEEQPDPAHERPARVVRGRGELYRLLEALSAHPDRWARIGSYPSKNTGGALASMFRNGQRPRPAGRWQFEGRANDDGGSDLYVRYLGPVEP